jgi:four helix bundle protein
MNYESALKTKSKQFALRIVNLHLHLCREKKETLLSRQILFAGTGIGVHCAAAELAFDKNELLEKLYGAREDCSATNYWLDLLFESNYIVKLEYMSLRNDCNVLLKMVTGIAKNARTELAVKTRRTYPLETAQSQALAESGVFGYS